MLCYISYSYVILFRFSVNMNVIGVSRIVELCRKLDRLEVLIVIAIQYYIGQLDMLLIGSWNNFSIA